MIPFKHQLQHTTAKYADTIKEQSPEINMKMVNIDVKYMQFVDGQKHELQYDPLKKLKNKNKNKIGPVSGLVQHLNRKDAALAEGPALKTHRLVHL